MSASRARRLDVYILLNTVYPYVRNPEKVLHHSSSCDVTRRHAAMRELRVRHQNYAWGARGNSAVRALASANALRFDDALDDDDSTPFAELWAGTHSSGMSTTKRDDDERGDAMETLRSYVDANAMRALGETCVKRFGTTRDVPFLMKMLSVSTALSIQAHPDKETAKRLHATNPEQYRDENHKPEMALCASERFEALSGFERAETVARRVEAHEELRRAVGDEDAVEALKRAVEDGGGDEERVKSAFKRVFTALMTADAGRVAACAEAMATRLREEGRREDDVDADVSALFLRLCEQYPGDVGVFCAYVLNYVVLRPGQAMYMAANEPHAYLSGECVEVMATSDNVVRAGLTPKFRDVHVLCSMLTYTLGAPDVLEGEVIDQCTRRYAPPFEEFLLDVVACRPGVAYGVAPRRGPSIWIIHRGRAVVSSATNKDRPPIDVAPGVVLFVDAGEELSIVVDDTAAESLLAYASTTNI